MEDFEKTKANRNGSKVFIERYSEHKVEALKKFLFKFNEKQRPKRFSISVDGEIIVPVTTDIDQFDDYLDFIDQDTERMEIRCFFGESNSGNRYLFHFKDYSPFGLGEIPKQNETDVEMRIVSALERQNLETELEQLRKKVKKLKRKLSDAQEQLSEKQFDVKELLTQGMQIYGHYNSSKNGTIPLQGITPQSEVSIEAELSESDKYYQELKNQFSEQELTQALKTWEVFSKYPELRKEFISIINQKSTNNGNT